MVCTGGVRTSSVLVPLRDPSIPKGTKIYVILKTISLLFACIVMGMSVDVLSVSLPDLRTRTGGNYEDLTRATAFGSLSCVFAIGAAFLCDKYPLRVDSIYAVSSFASAAAHLLVPWTPSVLLYGVVNAVHAIGMKTMIAAGDYMVATMWRDHASFFLYCVLLGFTIGGFIAPLFTAPFLSPDIAIDGRGSPSQPSYNISLQPANATPYLHFAMETTAQTFVGNVTNVSDVGLEEQPVSSRIEIPFAISAAFYVILGVIFLVFQFVSKPQVLARPRENEKYDKENARMKAFREIISPRSWADGNLWFGVLCLVGLSLFNISLRGHSETVMFFTFSYAIESKLKFGKNEAALLSSIANLIRFFGRVIGGLLSIFIPIQTLLLAEMTGALVFCFLLSFCLNSKLNLWLFICMYKVFEAPLYPGGFAWSNMYLKTSTTFFAYLLFIFNAVDFALDWYVGNLFQNVGPDSIMLYTLVCACIGFGSVIVLQILACYHGERFSKKTVTLELDNELAVKEPAKEIKDIPDNSVDDMLI